VDLSWQMGAMKFPCPSPVEPFAAILDSYRAKEHSAEYQAQACTDLAFKLRPADRRPEGHRELNHHTHHHTQFVIALVRATLQKSDPNAHR